ncbi:MAG: hypothetical protein M3Y91_02485 [Actinomycetota bacterium]|nr:hypothetical protein [Actinomycetota bacterium]
MRRAVMLVSVALLGAFATGCGAHGTVATVARHPPSCSMAPARLVSSTLGLAAGDPMIVARPPVLVCEYPQGGVQSQTLSVRFQTGITSDMDRAGIENAPPPRFQPVTGLADYAATAIQNGIRVLDADKYSIDLSVDAPASVSLNDEKRLVRSVFAQLG